MLILENIGQFAYLIWFDCGDWEHNTLLRMSREIDNIWMVSDFRLRPVPGDQEKEDEQLLQTWGSGCCHNWGFYIFYILSHSFYELLRLEDNILNPT